MDQMIFGENCTYSTDSSVTGLNNNSIILGPSGSGKTMSFTEPLLLETHERSLIVPVTKRRIVDKYGALLHQRGYDVQILDFVHPEDSNIGYDPLRSVRSDRDITALAQAIVMADSRKEKSHADPYWDQAAISLLSAEISCVRENVPDADFSDVLELHGGMDYEEYGSSIATSADRIFENLAEKHPKCFAVSCWKSFRRLPPRTAGCVFSTLNTTIDSIFSAELQKLMRKRRQVNPAALAHKRTVLFIITSPVNTALHRFVNLFYADMFRQLYEYAEEQPDGRLPVPVQFVADDFATGSKILNFAEYISLFHEKRIAVTLLLQSESQLASMYGTDDATTIINNCDTYVYLGGMDLQTARNVSIRLNAPLEDVLSMPIGQEILFRRGQKPIITSRYNILEDALYQQVTERYEKRFVSPAR